MRTVARSRAERLRCVHVKASANRTQGFVLLPVVLALTLIAAVSLLLNRGGAMNMSLAARGLQADAARYVAEAGLAQLNFQTQGRNCAGYTDLGTTTIGAHTFTATVNPKSGTPVALSATATTADGARATLTRNNVTVYQTTLQNFTLQPRTVLEDATIWKSSKTFNFGAATVLTVSNPNARALVKFDLASIPAGSIVQSAQFMLYKDNSSGGSGTGSTISAYRITRAWTEGTQTGAASATGVSWDAFNGTSPWASPGADYDTSLGATIPYDVAQGWKTWDVTQIVDSWIRGGYTNNGLILIGSSSMPGADYVSGDDTSQPNNTPKLVVSAYPPCGWVAPPVTQNFTAVNDALLAQGNANRNYGGSASVQFTAKSNDNFIIAQYDLSSIAPGTFIQNAKLRFYTTSMSSRTGSSMLLSAHALTRAWVEGTMTGSGTADGATWNRYNATQNWTTAGGDFRTPASGTVALPASFAVGWFEIPITALVQEWVDGVTPNNGVTLRTLVTDIFNVNLREAASNKPVLEVTY